MKSRRFNDLSIEECLLDAGCSYSIIEEVMRCINVNNERALNILNKYRCDLLEKIHQDQKQIDCLDDVLYQLKKYK